MEFLPLQLELHYFTKVMVVADPAFKPKEDEDQLFGVTTQVEIKQHRKDPRRWQVVLDIRTEAPEGQSIPYKVDLQAVGFFAVAPEVEEAKMPKLVRANAAAILYSSAREFLLTITGRGPWPPVYLPTTNFLGPPQPKAARQAQFAKSVPKPPKKEEREQLPAKPAPDMRKIRGKSKAKEILDLIKGEPSES